MEAARVPQQLLGELFVEKGLITREELAEALAEQKESGKRIGQILVMKGLVSRPDLTAVLAEQLGVEMEKQEGFGSGLWSEIRRRHPRVGRDEDADEPEEPVALPDANEVRLALIDDLEESAPEDPVDDEHTELENLRQQLSFASTRLEEERAGHKGTLRLLEDSRRDLERLAREVDDWRERAARGEDSKDKELADAQLAELEATVTELRGELEARERQLAERDSSEAMVESLSEQVEAHRVKSEDLSRLLDDARTKAVGLEATVAELRHELEVRDRELAAGAEVQTELGAEVGRLEDELQSLRDQHSGSKDAIAALTAQVDEQRVGAADSQRLLDEARAEADALEATAAELRSELAKARKEGSESRAAVAALTVQVDEQRASCRELERSLEEARADSAAFEATIADLREELSSLGDTGELEEELTAIRAEAARLKQVSEKRKAELDQLADEREQALAREAREFAAFEATIADLREELSSREKNAKKSERKLGELRAELAAGEGARSREAAARVAAETELEAVQAELAERPELPPVEEPAATHMVFLPTAKGYALAEVPGPTPDPGACEDVDEVRFVVSRIGPSPLPADRRRCAFLEVA
ncbi:MAG: hypothetical protein ABWY51_09190 [Gaiellaceae bacterium]